MISAFPYVGGKQQLARQIIEMLPPHTIYVEVFAGSGAVFFNKPKAPQNVLNDSDLTLYNLYVVIRDQYAEFCHKVLWTPYHEYGFDELRKIESDPELPKIDRALATFFLIRASINGGRKYFRIYRDGRSTNSWNMTTLLPVLQRLNHSLMNVILTAQDFRDVFPRWDTEDTVFYCDPPYYKILGMNNYYMQNFTELDHADLFKHLRVTKAKWLLSYDDHTRAVRRL